MTVGMEMAMRWVIIIVVFFLSAVSLQAETYTWIDDSGTVNFADDLSLVPARYRSKARVSGFNDEAASAPVPAVTVPAGAKPVAMPGAKAEPEMSYGGKTLADWKKALQAVQAEIKQQDALVKKLAKDVQDRDQLYVGRAQFDARQRYNAAVEAFNKASARFDQLLAEARRAGAPL